MQLISSMTSDNLKNVVTEYDRMKTREPSLSNHRGPDSERNVEFVNIELQGLPSTISSKQIKDMYFENQHIVQNDPEVNLVTGTCSGKAKVKVRCSNGLKSDSVIKGLIKKGAKFKVSQSNSHIDAKSGKPFGR